MEEIKISINPNAYRKAMNIYWYLKWKKYVEGRILREIKFAFLAIFIAILFSCLNYTFFGIIVFIIVIVISFFFIKEIIKIFFLRKEFQIEIENNITNSYNLGIREIIVQYNQYGFFERVEEGNSYFYNWTKFSKTILSKDFLFIIKNDWKFVYHFSKEELGEGNFNKLVKYISHKTEMERVEIGFPLWYKLLLKSNNI